jgi:hypothetical protein
MGITTDKIFALTASSLGLNITASKTHNRYTVVPKRFPNSPPSQVFIDEHDDCKIHCSCKGIEKQMQERFNQIAQDLLEDLPFRG